MFGGHVSATLVAGILKVGGAGSGYEDQIISAGIGTTWEEVEEGSHLGQKPDFESDQNSCT